MVRLIGIASMMMSLFIVLTVHPFQNETVNLICFPLAGIVYSILLCIAEDIEDKLEKRIEELEKKVEDIQKTERSDKKNG